MVSYHGQRTNALRISQNANPNTEIHELSYLRLWIGGVLDELMGLQAEPASGEFLLQRAGLYLSQNFADPALQ